jgi:hypothetical protein
LDGDGGRDGDWDSDVNGDRADDGGGNWDEDREGVGHRDTETGVRMGTGTWITKKMGQCQWTLHLTTNTGSALLDNDERNTSQDETLTILTK